MRRYLLLFACLLLGTAGAAAQEMRIAAVVNDDVISMADLTGRMRLVFASSQIENTPQNEQRIASQVLRMLIEEKLQMQEAKRLNVTVSQKEIDDAMARIEAQNRLPKGGLDQMLKARGIDRSTLVTQMTATIAWGKVVNQRITQTTPVSDEDIEAALARLKENEGQPRARVAEIFLAVETPQQEEDVHRFADRLFEQLRGGARFPDLARQFSQSATAAVGGDIGWVVPGQLASEVGATVQRLNPGEVSPPVRAAGGFYLILVIEKQRAGREAGEDTRVSLMQVMFPVPPAASPADKQKATQQAESAAKAAKSCGELAKIGREQAPQTSGDLGEVRVGDLPAELRPTVLRLKVAEASPPIPLRGGVGVLMVCGREEAPDALPGKDEVADGLLRDRFENLARRYMRDLRRAAFVDVRG